MYNDVGREKKQLKNVIHEVSSKHKFNLDWLLEEESF